MKNILIAATITISLLAGGCSHKQAEQEKYFAALNAQIAEQKAENEKEQAFSDEFYAKRDLSPCSKFGHIADPMSAEWKKAEQDCEAFRQSLRLKHGLTAVAQ